MLGLWSSLENEQRMQSCCSATDSRRQKTADGEGQASWPVFLLLKIFLLPCLLLTVFVRQGRGMPSGLRGVDGKRGSWARPRRRDPHARFVVDLPPWHGPLLYYAINPVAPQS